jgi:hypothetical protein
MTMIRYHPTHANLTDKVFIHLDFFYMYHLDFKTSKMLWLSFWLFIVKGTLGASNKKSCGRTGLPAMKGAWAKQPGFFFHFYI